MFHIHLGLIRVLGECHGIKDGAGTLDPTLHFAADFAPGGIAVADDGDSGDLYTGYVGANLEDCAHEKPPNFQCTYAIQIVRLNADASLDPAFSTDAGFPADRLRGRTL